MRVIHVVKFLLKKIKCFLLPRSRRSFLQAPAILCRARIPQSFLHRQQPSAQWIASILQEL